MCSSDLNWGRCPTDGKLAKAWLDEAPTVDAVEVVHGRWLAWKEKLPKVVLIDTKRLGVFCSVCNMHNDYMSNYCPNCGAKMDGDGNA